jgi:quercetin dioxygenase-like cupin family protein
MGTLHDSLTGQHLQFRKTGKQTGRQLLEAEVLLDQSGHVPRHLHLRHDERVEVLEGALSIQLGGRGTPVGRRRQRRGASPHPAPCA